MPSSALRSQHLSTLLLVIVSIVGAGFVPSVQGQVNFFAPPTYAGNAQSGVFVADFNGDGKLDIMTGDGTLNLGNGNGTFITGTPVTGGVLAVGDFTGNGTQDVLQQGTGTLLVLLGNGDGTFQAPITTDSASSLFPLVVADVNGDGKADVIGLYNGSLWVYLSNGNGTFAVGVSYPVGGNTGIVYEAITLGDFNQDGKIDIALSLSGDNVAGEEVVFLGNGDGTFQAGKTSAGVLYPSSVVAGDFNGDGKLDLAIASQVACSGPCTTAILLGNGDGTFRAPTSLFNGAGLLASADVNGDGKLDLVLLSNIVQIFLGNGDGTFSNTRSYFPSPGNYNGVAWFGLAIADFNQDGKLDVGAANNVLLGNGDGSFQGWPAVLLPNNAGYNDPLSNSAARGSTRPATSGPVASSPTNADTTVAIGDFANNGNASVAVTSNFNGNLLYIFSNDGAGTLSVAHTYTLQQPSSAIATADVNGDGKLDLIVEGSDPVSGNWSYSVLLGNGDGSFGAPVLYQENVTATSGVGLSIVIGDFNNDGKPDLAFPQGNFSLAVLLGNGDGTFGAPTYLFDGGSGSILAADFNNDGNLDLAASGASGPAILLGNGNGTFQPATFVTAKGTVPGTGWATADLTGDGNADILDNSVYLGVGNGTFTTLNFSPPKLGVSLLADVNGDGKPDEVGTMQAEGASFSLGVALGNGDGTFGPYITVIPSAPALGFTFVGAADMNGDGKVDLIATGLGSVFVILNQTVSAAGTTFSPGSLSFSSQTVGSSSGATPVTLTNSGAIALSVSGVSFGGANAGEFSQTNNCSTVQPLASCTINVTFTPTAAGAATANLMVADNAGTGSQVVVVSGMGAAAADFTLGMGSGGSSSTTITAGGTATFGLSITPAGSFSGTVNFTCAVTPAASPAPVCSVPASVSVSGSSATAVTVSVTTTAAGGAVSGWFGDWPSGWMVGWALALGVSSLMFVGRRRLVYAPVVVLILLMVGCGGGSSTPGPTSNQKGTPAGTYTATVTATSGSLSHQAALTVIVQ